MCTQSFKADNINKLDNNAFLSSSAPSSATCLSCQLILPTSSPSNAIRTIDEESHLIFISTQYPSSQSRYRALRQIVMKALSVETTHDGLNPIMFGDSTAGYSITMVFKIKDSTARGSERKYALIITAEDESELVHSWSLVVENLREFIKLIKDRITELELSKTMNNTELMDNNERFYRRSLPKSKNLTELLEDKKLFIKIHLWASNLLCNLN
ncbi:hypothetical protein PACTADRAFT_48062 [Pachysolen tannophilus NRRL Y-2460]|uniref:UDENN FLCN/SMCR8-type domain-containing protein n=1 Tax=Pachysolen tannophilus NRRL Y-2460 TaxID=669874 RepID=A0A1E4U2Q3_PACTA|nr:hypothetical protein PACTADRAFT_48062 [Pachysolen tannophilus NRRL Y-2460]